MGKENDAFQKEIERRKKMFQKSEEFKRRIETIYVPEVRIAN